MTVVSSKEFATHQKKFYNLALNERVIIKRGKNKFSLAPLVDDDDAFDLSEAKARANDEDTSADEFLQFLRGLRK